MAKINNSRNFVTKSWKKHISNGRAVINLSHLTGEAATLPVGIYDNRLHFVAKNRAILINDNKAFLFFYQHNKLKYEVLE